MEIERVCANCNLKDGEGYCSVLAYALKQAAWLGFRGGKVKPVFDDGCSLFEPSEEALDDFRQDCRVETALDLADARGAAPGPRPRGALPPSGLSPLGGQSSPQTPRVSGLD